MPNTFSQIYIQYIFAVNGRHSLLDKSWRLEVFKYMSGIITAKSQKPMIVNGVENHVHILVSLNPDVIISDLARDIKNNSSKFINEQGFLKNKFSWQEGYGAFSYSHSQRKNVYQYILNQEDYHQKISFKEEYLDLLKQFEIEYDEKYLFDWLEE